MYYNFFDYHLAQSLARFEGFKYLPEQKKYLMLLVRLLSYQVRQGDTSLNLESIASTPFELWPKHLGTNDLSIKWSKKIPEKILEQILPFEQEIEILKDASHFEFFLKESKLVTKNPKKYLCPLVYLHPHLYFYRYYNYEYEAMEVLLRYAKNISKKPFLISKENDAQKKAIELSIENSLFVMCGGPGTGKTSTLTKMIALQLKRNPNLKIAICAPTGKAVSRLQQVFQETSSQNQNETLTFCTIHRLLAYTHKNNNYRHHHDNLLDYNLIVVDEVSMIDISLFSSLLRALKPETSLLLVGDPDQLHSVEAGCVLKEINKISKYLGNAFVRLEKNYRYKDVPKLGELNEEIRKGNTKNILEILQNKNLSEIKYYALEPVSYEKNMTKYTPEFIEVLEPIICRVYEKIYNPKLSENETIDKIISSLYNFALLTPLRHGLQGVQGLNKLVTSILEKFISNHDNFEMNFEKNASTRYYPIVIRENHYKNNLYNGDLGLVKTVKNQDSTAFFYRIEKTNEMQDSSNQDSKNSLREIPVNLLPQHELAWALTVHASQGSEFDEIVLILPTEENSLVTLELIYTAITRARKKITIIGPISTLTKGLNSRTKRISTLSKLFEEAYLSLKQ